MGEMNIEKIKEMPTVYNGVHESIYQSSQLLFEVVEMLKRGDSAETILSIIYFIKDNRDDNG
jgi:hypothetical protein